MLQSREDLAWVAGIHSGEGCIFCHTQPGRGRTIGVKITQSGESRPEMLTRLEKILGFGHVRGPYKAAGNRKPVWQYATGRFEYVQAFIAATWHWLTPEKKQQATDALNKYHSLAGVKADG